MYFPNNNGKKLLEQAEILGKKWVGCERQSENLFGRLKAKIEKYYDEKADRLDSNATGDAKETYRLYKKLYEIIYEDDPNYGKLDELVQYYDDKEKRFLRIVQLVLD